ncbi:hypothetical protein C0J52_18111 [Blattella germanica]|nr:hypothetical protein C0J52_18111 [Blattella germanica]
MGDPRLTYQVKASQRCNRWQQQVIEKDLPRCPADFDGIICWPPTDVGDTASQPCPGIENGYVNRTCGMDTSWESLNYTTCGLDMDTILEMRKQFNKAQDPSNNPDAEFIMKLLKECRYKREHTPPPEGLYCPIKFDGLSCWNYTSAGETAYLPCPYFVAGFDPRRFAFRHCMEDGKWFRHPESGQSWSNYTTCVDLEDLEFRQVVNSLYVSGYSISVVALCLSLVIFFSFRSLKCTRIAIHVQLFLSFASNNIMWLIWYRNVVDDPSVVKNNGYLMVANYMWMFCEGLHLHLALVVVFVKERVVMRWFHATGWGLPFVLTAIYAGVRSSSPEDSQRCWMEDSLTQWILTAPVLISMVASTVFLINVVRVLLTKLHGASASPAPIGMKKAVRATFILIPLFGIHHILIPFRPEPGHPGEQIYQVLSAVLVSLQVCQSIS